METYVELRAVISDFQAKMAAARAEMSATAKHGSSTFSGLSSLGKGALLGLGAAAIGVGTVSVKMAADFQESMTQLVTGAGESEKNIKQVANGILRLAPQVGETTQQLASGMYMIESAGYHGAAGLQVLKAAAQGAKVGNADLGTVADAVTTILNDYHLSAGQAATVTSKLVETVASGKTHMQDLAGSLAAVAPAASAAHVGLDQVLGAMATMTAKGTPAADAATYLRQTILQLSNPTAKAATEMQALGLNAIDVSSHLGQRGLTGTLSLLTAAIVRHMGPQGTVLIEQLKKAASSTSTYQKILANLPPVQQTYVGALADMVGGTKSMQAALELTGSSASTFTSNVTTISRTTSDAKGNVQGWSQVQGDFNFKLAQAKATVEVLAIKIGTALIPILEKVATTVEHVLVWLEKHRTVAIALAAVVGGVLVTAIGAFVASLVTATVTIGATEIALAPIALAVAALGAAAILLATHWHQVWTAIYGFIQQYAPEIAIGLGLLLGPIGLIMGAILLLATNWKTVWDGIQQITGTAVSMLLGVIRNLGDAVFAVVEGILGAMSHLPFVGHYFAQANRAAKQFQKDFDSTLSGIAADAAGWGQTAGQNLVGGVAIGMQQNLQKTLNVTASTAASVVGAMRKGLGQNSPSRFTIEMGKNLMRGLEIGTANQAPTTAQAFAQTMRGILPALAGGTATASFPGATGLAAAGGPTGDLVIQVDGKDLIRVLGPYIRDWWLTGPNRNATRGRIQT